MTQPTDTGKVFMLNTPADYIALGLLVMLVIISVMLLLLVCRKFAVDRSEYRRRERRLQDQKHRMIEQLITNTPQGRLR